MESSQKYPKFCSRNKKSWDLLKKKYDIDLIGFTDSDWAGHNTYQKSTLGYVFMLAEGPISWSSKKQSPIALSYTEASIKEL